MPSRALTDAEIATARTVFGDSVAFGPVRLTRDSVLAFWAPKVLGNTIHLRSDWGHFVGTGLELTAIGQITLIHELGHIWQYQNGGLAYIPRSVWAQGLAALRTGGRSGAYRWREPLEAGVPWARWNPEQQAQAIQAYFQATQRMGTRFSRVDDREIISALTPMIEKVRRGEGA